MALGTPGPSARQWRYQHQEQRKLQPAVPFHQPSTLESIPTEVRLIIYGLIFGNQAFKLQRGGMVKVWGLDLPADTFLKKPDKIMVQSADGDDLPCEDLLSVLRICRQIRQEALPLFYDTMPFISTMSNFGSLPDLSAPFWTRLRTLHIQEYEETWPIAFGSALFPAVPIAFPDLQHLIVSAPKTEEYDIPKEGVHTPVDKLAADALLLAGPLKLSRSRS